MKPPTPSLPATCAFCGAPATVVVNAVPMCAGCRAMEREIADQKLAAVITEIRRIKAEYTEQENVA